MRRITFIYHSIFLIILGAISICFLTSDQEKYSYRIKTLKITPKKKSALLTVSSTITNNTKDTLKYINMTCVWDVIYFSNNKKAIVLGPLGCDGNHTEVYTIAPNETSKREFDIAIVDKVKGSPIKFKIGIALISPKEGYHVGILRRQWVKSHAHLTIWSNTIQY